MKKCCDDCGKIWFTHQHWFCPHCAQWEKERKERLERQRLLKKKEAQ